MTLEEMLDELESMGRRKTPRSLIESVLFYYAAIIINKYNIRKTSGSKHIKYFGLFFGESGVGKDFTMNEIEKLFDLSNYSKIMFAYYRKQIENLPEEPDNIKEILRYMPKSTTIGVEGTSEGLYQVIQSQKLSGFGSLNLESREIGEHISSSSGLLSKLKELSDGYLKSKIIKGDDNTEMKEDVNNIIANFLGLGSKKGATSDSRKELKRIASSGLYRRTFIIDSKQRVEKNLLETNIANTQKHISEINEKHKQDFVARTKLNLYNEKFIEHSEQYKIRLEEIDNELIEKAYKNQLNEFIQYDTGSLEIIESLAHIIAFLENDDIVDKHHLEQSFLFFKRTRETIEDTFKSIRPYRIMYDLLKLKDDMTISEMAEFDADIPISKSQMIDNIQLLEELCYRKDEILFKSDGKVTRYKILPLPINKLDKLIFSLHTEGKKEFAINFKPVELTWEQVSQLVVSKVTESFCPTHFEPSAKALHGHREAKSYKEGANIIAFDIDNGMTIKEAQMLLSEFTYLIYTTKSHKIQAYNFIDRFRILIPTKNTFYVTSEQYKQLYINIEEFLGIQNNDIQTRNVSRLWYTNPNATIYQNVGELLDVTPLLPNTDKSDSYLPKMNIINEKERSGDISNRVAGIVKWAIANAIPGQRNTTLFKMGCFLKDIGEDYQNTVISVNNMIYDPLTKKDIRAMIRSIERN